MKIIHEKIEGNLYTDILLTEKEIGFLLEGKMIEGEIPKNYIRHFIGIAKTFEDINET